MAPRRSGNGRYKQHGGRVSPAHAQKDDPHHPSSSNHNHQNKEVSSKRKKSYQTNSMLDFSEDLKFKLGGEPLSDYHVRIEIKSSTTLLHKSK